jgi:DNA repair protein RadC
VVSDVVHDADDEIGCATGIEERVLALALDAKHRILAWHLVGKGGVAACTVEPGSVFRGALAAGAAAVVVVHNHPSGVPDPSADDVALTERLRRGGELLGVRVLDHVIVTADRSRYFSFLDAGLLGPGA